MQHFPIPACIYFDTLFTSFTALEHRNFDTLFTSLTALEHRNFDTLFTSLTALEHRNFDTLFTSLTALEHRNFDTLFTSLTGLEHRNLCEDQVQYSPFLDKMYTMAVLVLDNRNGTNFDEDVNCQSNTCSCQVISFVLSMLQTSRLRSIT